MDGITSSENGRLRVVFVGNFLPRKCGIATFTTDLYGAVAQEISTANLQVVAMDSPTQEHEYPEAVTCQIRQDHLDDYRDAARFINDSGADLVCLQHEFGIFGGDAGGDLAELLARLDTPVVTTLHTVLEEPAPAYYRSMLDVIRYSERLVVMSHRAVRILREVYGMPEQQITLIHHGTPDMPFVEPDAYKAAFGLAGRPVILTFGLLSPNKGIASLLEALPAVVERVPDLAYIVLGATHPEVRRRHGEAYREGLEQMVRDLGLTNNVIFHDRFVELDELLQFLAAADIYLTPYLNREQIASGTLAYAVAMGKAVISTPYWYAEELLADGRGILVEFGDAEGLADAIGRLVSDDALRLRLRRATYAFGRRMTWNVVGRRYVEEFEQILNEQRTFAQGTFAQRTFAQRTFAQGTFAAAREAKDMLFTLSGLPDVNLDYLSALTDEFGLVQHAHGSSPDLRHGYSADDVGRALVVLAQARNHHGEDGPAPLIGRYLDFLERAQTPDGAFHNFMEVGGRFLDERGSEDTFGRVVWGLGAVLRWTEDEGLRARAARLLDHAAPHLGALTYPRAKAYAVCGLAEVLRCRENTHALRHALEELADGLVDLYRVNRDDGWRDNGWRDNGWRDNGWRDNGSREDGSRHGGWHWFEDIVTYGNARLCEALLAAYDLTGDDAMRRCGLESLDFLIRTQWNGRYFDFVGNEGWWLKSGARAIFSQQPIEAGYLTTACIAAYEITGRDCYLSAARHCFDWFFGRNRLNAALYDPRTGAVADGLDPQGVNRNRGAESVIAFLLALLSLSTLRLERSEKISA